MSNSDSTEAPVPEGLTYVSDEAPGIRRLRRGQGFVYTLPNGKRVVDPAELDRIRRLAVPPAYVDVWICPSPDGHLQATGRDARGRKQYRYHADWQVARGCSKFERMRDFGSALPRIRARVRRTLAERKSGSPCNREQVLAAMIRLLDTTLVRIGNDEYTRANGSYGLSTLRSDHVALRGDLVRLKFPGKSGVARDVAVEDAEVAEIVRRCRALATRELFVYEDDAGLIRDIGSADVNAYLREAGGMAISAKDFRTWHASVGALDLCRQIPPDTRRNMTRALLSEVAGRLGNTVAVCRKSYVHPRVLDLIAQPGAVTAQPVRLPRKPGLTTAERRLLAMLAVPAVTAKPASRRAR